MFSTIFFSLFTILLFIILLTLHALFFFSSDIKTFFKRYITIRIISIIIFIFIIFFIIIRLLIFFKFFNSASDISIFFFEKILIFCSTISTQLYLDYVFAHTLSQCLTTFILIIITALYYTVAFDTCEVLEFTFYCLCLFISGFIFITTTNLLIMFIAFEFILIPTALVLDLFSKTSKAKEATRFMIIWTQIGAILLFFSIYKLFGITDFFGLTFYTLKIAQVTINISVIILFFGFGTKMPIWPFYWWLPEAHVEAPTNFSIILSGVSIKFAFLGYLRFIELLGCGDFYWILTVIAIIGCLDAIVKVDGENDIKKIVAYQTVAEMHVLVAFVTLDVINFFNFILFLIPAHCWISTIGFIVVDIIMKRYHTRNSEELYGIFAKSPQIVKFIFLITFIIGSIPGTSAYTIEFYMQLISTTLTFNFIFFIFMQLFLVIWSKNIWWTVWGGDPLNYCTFTPFTLTKAEQWFIFILILQLIPGLIFIDFITI